MARKALLAALVAEPTRTLTLAMAELSIVTLMWVLRVRDGCGLCACGGASCRQCWSLRMLSREKVFAVLMKIRCGIDCSPRIQIRGVVSLTCEKVSSRGVPDSSYCCCCWASPDSSSRRCSAIALLALLGESLWMARQ